ncbi:Autophagy-related protein 18a [Durusdinium trenchii]
MGPLFLAASLLLTCLAFSQCGEEGCVTDDSVLLQPRLGHVEKTKEAETQSTCEPLNYNNGDCVGRNTCFECDFDDKKVLPANKDRFPKGFLLCQGGSTTCTTADTDTIVRFRSASDYLECTGVGTCTDAWNVKNAGAACCSEKGACSLSTISLSPDGGCQNDMCCDGVDSCSQGELGGIQSLSCRAARACSSATVDLARDLYCDAISLVGGSGGGSCQESTFTFSDEFHVIDCFGAYTCKESTFDFASGSSISLQCQSPSGVSNGQACKEANIQLKGDSCIDINCDGNNLGSDCEGLTVEKQSSDNCYYQGPDAFLPAGCIEANRTECGDIPRDPICCHSDGGDPDSCADCCEPVTTTAPDITTTTTTTTSKKKPYSDFRRNRRTERRNSRQHRRQSRQYKYS